MKKNIIFDFAGVIMNLNIERDTRSLNAAGLPDWNGCLANSELSRPLVDFLNGLMSWDDFLPLIRPFCKQGVTDEELYNAMNDVLDDVPKSRLDWIVSLRKDYNIYLLSNICEMSWNICRERFESTGYKLSDCFDDVFLSFEMNLAKPDLRIYQEVFRTTGIKPADTIYFDDSKENILAGTQLGIQSIIVPMNNIESLPFYISTRTT